MSVLVIEPSGCSSMDVNVALTTGTTIKWTKNQHSKDPKHEYDFITKLVKQAYTEGCNTIVVISNLGIEGNHIAYYLATENTHVYQVYLKSADTKGSKLPKDICLAAVAAKNRWEKITKAK